jgi:enterochelin esterase-like enzyme
MQEYQDIDLTKALGHNTRFGTLASWSGSMNRVNTEKERKLNNY